MKDVGKVEEEEMTATDVSRPLVAFLLPPAVRCRAPQEKSANADQSSGRVEAKAWLSTLRHLEMAIKPPLDAARPLQNY